LIIVVVVLPLLWSNWSTVKDFPGISSIVAWFSQAPLPKADPQRFAVALAHLEHDKDQQYERLLREVLKDFEGVQLLQFDRTISLAGTQPEESEKKGHAKARQYLEVSGAHVLIWGLVLSRDDKSAPRLYWTTGKESKRAKELYQMEKLELKLPDLFWSDLAEVLRLVVVTQYSEFIAQEGRFIADQLAPFITRVHRLLDKSAEGRDWSKVQFFLGNALLMFGEQTGTNKPLEEAVTAYRAALTKLTQKLTPLDWARTQMNLGNALVRLGEQESNPARLKEAVVAYQAALTEWTPENMPLDWARTQNNLGHALMRLGEQESNPVRLEEAVTTYRAALTKLTQKLTPLDWAMTQMNLGTALMRLGERESGTARLEEAVEAYQAALTELAPERMPLDWARTQNNLGYTLVRLGERESGTARLEEAVTAYRAALTKLTRKLTPLDWARTQMNLGDTLIRLGEQESNTARLEEAVVAYRAALTELTPERARLSWARIQSSLGNALMRLGERESGTAHLEGAVVAYRAALTEWTPEHIPRAWAGIQNNLGTVLATLGERKADATLICEALERQLMVREGSANFSTGVVNNAKRMIAILKNTFDFSTYEACIAKNGEALKRMGLP